MTARHRRIKPEPHNHRPSPSPFFRYPKANSPKALKPHSLIDGGDPPKDYATGDRQSD